MITSSNDNDMRIGYNYQVPLLLTRMIDEFWKLAASIYIKKKVCVFVCLFVLHTFGHGTSKCNEILHRIPFCPEEGQDGVFGI